MDNIKKDMMNMTNGQRMELVKALKICEELIMTSVDLSEQKMVLEKKVTELEEVNENLNNRLEKAIEVFHQQEEDINYAEARTKSSLARNMQKVRDEIYTIGSTLHNYAIALSEKPASKLTLVQVNNLQAGLSSVIAVLEDNGLWNSAIDPKPDLSMPEKVEKPKPARKPKAKKKDETVEQQLESVVSESEDKSEA